MSGLSYICEYSSQSEESDSEAQENTKRSRLPVPDLSFVSAVQPEGHVDVPQFHGDRIRSFPHVRGNWATFVYVKYCEDNNQIINLVNKLKDIVCSLNDSWHICDDFHISLSKTVVLKYHWITTFNTSVQKALCDFESFELNFDGVKIYCNEENSRTFISLEVDFMSQKHLATISKKVDEVLAEFKLSTFYEKPSFHMSVLWVNGNKKSDLTNILDHLNDIVTQEVGNSLRTVCIDKVQCKSGNKLFRYSLL